MNLSKQQLLQIIIEETASMTEEDEEEADVVTDYTDPDAPDPDVPDPDHEDKLPNKANKQLIGRRRTRAGEVSGPPRQYRGPSARSYMRGHQPDAKERKYRESLTRSRLQQITREETLNELEEGRFSDTFSRAKETFGRGRDLDRAFRSRAKETIGSLGKAALEKGKEAVGIPTHTGGRVTRGGSRGRRNWLMGPATGEDPSETPAEAEAGMAHDIARQAIEGTTDAELRDEEHRAAEVELNQYESLTRSRLQQIIREETLNELEEGRFSDAFSRARETLGSLGKAAREKVPAGLRDFQPGPVFDFARAGEAAGLDRMGKTGGRVTRGGSQGKRAQAGSVLGVDASETAAEAEAALAAETPYGPQHSVHTATRGARGSGRVTAGGSGGDRAKAGKLLGVDPSQDPVDVDPAKFPGGPGESRPFTYFDRPGEPRPRTLSRRQATSRRQGRMAPVQMVNPPEGLEEHQAESLTRLRLRQMVMEELQVNEEEKWIQGAEEDIEKRGTEGVCTGEKFGGPTCRSGTKRYNLAKTFRKMAKKRKKKKKE